MEKLEIPEKSNPEFDEALSALVRSAFVVKQLLFMSVASDVDMKELLGRHMELLTNADTAIESWRLHLGIDDEL